MRLTKIFPILLVAIAPACLTSCNDDDTTEVIVIEQDAANLRQSNATYNSLSFTWDKVANVNQYGYSLTDADGAIVSEGVTDVTSVTIPDLLTDTPYTFELRVYGAYGEASYRSTLKTSTLPIRQLDTPQPVASQSSNKVALKWESVEGAAAYEYTYSIGDNVITRTTAEAQCEIAGLAPGKHTVTVRALSDYGGYTDSEVIKVEAVRSRTEIGSVVGTYTSGLIRRNNSWTCTMHIFDDNSYVIDGFYQGDGYNLDIYVDNDPDTGEAFLGIYNFVSFPLCEYYVMDTGRSSVPQLDFIPGLIDGAYGSSFAGDATSGSLTINTRYATTSSTDKFVW